MFHVKRGKNLVSRETLKKHEERKNSKILSPKNS